MQPPNSLEYSVALSTSSESGTFTRSFGRTILAAVILAGASVGTSSAAVLWTNPITGTNPNTANPYTAGQTVHTDVSVSGISRGAGATGTNANDRYNASSWNTSAIDMTAYFSWTITPDAGKEINFTNVQIASQISGTGPTSYSFRSSLDNFGSNISGFTVNSAGNGATISLAGAQFQGITEAITFRLYAWTTSNSGGTFSVNSFTFNGETADAVPEPTNALAGALIAAGLLRRRRRSGVALAN